MSAFGAAIRRGSRWLPAIGAAALVGTLAELALPLALGASVDAFVTGDDATPAVLTAVGLVVLSVLCELVDAFAGIWCVADTAAWLRNRLVRRVLSTRHDVSRALDTGDLVSRVSGNAVDAAQAGPSLVTLVSAALPPAGSLALLAWIDLYLALAFVIGVVLVALVLRAFARDTAAVVGDYMRTQGRIAARLSESLAGVRTIAAAGTAEAEERRVLEPLPELREQGERTWRVLARSGAQAAFVGPLVLVAVLAVGGLLLVDGRISPGDLFAAGQYAVLGAGLGGVTGTVGRLARARAGAVRADEVLALPERRHGERRLPEGPGRLELRGVSAAVDGRTLLEGVDLDLPGGCGVAVVGRSGAGKSLLAEVAAGLREPDEGQVLLDGVPLDELTHDDLRAAVGCAFERPVLVGETVGHAIALGLPSVAARTAAVATHAHEYVSRLPLGYDTPLTDAPMSGGEAQRLGLARAWSARRLLVLDDATSSLDTVTEMQIARALTEDRQRRTRLIVTHRATTAARADLVVWLEAGRLRAVGTHAELWTQPDYRGVFG